MRPEIYKSIPAWRSESRFFLTGPVPVSLAQRLHAVAAYCEREGATADSYGGSAWMAAAEARVAGLVGQPAAIFMPTGAMAQQIACRLYSDAACVRRIAMHPTCQMELNEHHAYRELHRLEADLLGDPGQLLTPDDLSATSAAALVIELPMRQLGGRAPSRQALQLLLDAARNQGIKTHLDGARLLELLPHYGCQAADIGAGFDSVYLSGYKLLTGLGGAFLAGGEDFIDQARLWRRRHGGDIKVMTPYAASALMHLEYMQGRVDGWYQAAVALAGRFAQLPGLHVPHPPQSNLFHLYFNHAEASLLAARDAVARSTGVWLFDFFYQPPGSDHPMTEVVVHSGFSALPEAELSRALTEFVRHLEAG